MAVYVEVAIEQATNDFDKLYTYRVPKEMDETVLPGTTVLVPFGRGQARPRIGVVLKESEAPQSLQGIKSVLSAVPSQEALTQEALAMVRYLKQATFCTWYEAVKTVVPRGGRYKAVREETGRWMLKTEMELKRETVYELVQKGEEPKKKWTEKQRRVMLFLQEKAQGKEEICRACEVGPAVAEGLAKQGVLCKFSREKVYDSTAEKPVQAKALPQLSEAQRQVVEELLAKEAKKDWRPALLYGITGSGKTSVFLHLVQHCIQMQKTCLVLVPEIGLTQQMIDAFQAVFAGRVAVQHSALSQGERFAQWNRVRSGVVDIVIGTRSAVFAPLENIGLIVVDEEQEKSYQSEASPRYDALEVAKRRAVHHKALLVLASATPSISDYHAAKQARYSLHTLLQRYKNLPLPTVQMADMRGEMAAGNIGAVGERLTAAIHDVLAEKRQVILLLNRRGYHRVGVCRVCGHVLKCEDCSVPFVFHKGKQKASAPKEKKETGAQPPAGSVPDVLSLWKKLADKSTEASLEEQDESVHATGGRLLCHYCGKTLQPAPLTCPDCKGEIRYTGFGTQRVEEELQLRFPKARVLRMDLDTTRRKGAHKTMLRSFRKGEYDILLGTQMVAKGLDFENVGLVGVIGIDSLLFGQGYRALEHVFSLVTQVVGRAGRFNSDGYAMIQTTDPENAVLQLAAGQNYPAFYEQEIEFRRTALYPPFCGLCVVGFVANDEKAVMHSAQKFAQIFAKEAQKCERMPLRVLGPAPMHVSKVAGQFRWRLTIKCRADEAFRELLARVLHHYGQSGRAKQVGVYVDFNADTVY